MESYISKIIIVDERFLDDLKQASITDFEDFSNPSLDTKIISLPLRDGADIAALSRVVDVSEIRPGSVLVKPGYSDQFVAVDSFSEDLVLRKYGLFVQLCHALGAKTVSVKGITDVELEERSKMATAARLKVTGFVAGGSAELESHESILNDDLRKSIMEIRTEAHGGTADIEAAENLIAQYSLHKDSLFTDLVNMCKLTKNRLSRHELNLDFSKDVKKVFDSSIQAKVDVMGKFYGGGIDFERTRNAFAKNRTATKLSIIVEF